MSHETIIYGYLEGATWRKEEYRKYQRKNLEIIARLPDDDEWPYLTRTMFSTSDPDNRQGTFRRHILHFGTSVKEGGFTQRDMWISKFERLLSDLYWHSVIVHFNTDVYGQYLYEWTVKRDSWKNGKLITIYDIEELPRSSNWKRKLSCNGKVVELYDS